MKIRKYQDSDKEALIRLWRQLFPDEPPHNEPETVIAEKLRIDDLIFVVEENDELLGACMAGYDGHRGWLYSVGVAAEYRRKSVGKDLISHVLSSLKEMGCRKVNIQIRAGNDTAENFYKSIGFIGEDRVSMGIRID